MTKKKNSRKKHQKDISFADTSEEELNEPNEVSGKVCPHISRGVNFGQVRKALKVVESITICSGCANNSTEADELPEVWLCLQCGYRGCGRMSENKHGLQHFKTIHSDCHSLVWSSTSGVVWCYECDNDVALQSSRNLKQCCDFILKLKCNTANKINIKTLDKSANAPQNAHVVKEADHVVKEAENAVEEAETVQNSVQVLKTTESEKTLKNDKKNAFHPTKTVKGLRNLGNTCYANAVLQNLAQTFLFFYEMENSYRPDHLWEVPKLVITGSGIEDVNDGTLKITLQRQFPIVKELLNLLRQMLTSTSTKTEIINPSRLLTEVNHKCPQFVHFQQQDSHEFLRQLMDCVREEEIKRQKKAILKHFELENINPESVDEEMKKLIKAYSGYASHTIIEKVFGGLLISTVFCEECKVSSQVFEPFMDLSLPLFEEKAMRNRKSGDDSDENADEQYVISKQKNDPPKRSKFQEKKMKQLAKKEKKKAKNTQNKRRSQSHSNENLEECLQSDSKCSVDNNNETSNKLAEDQDLTESDSKKEVCDENELINLEKGKLIDPDLESNCKINKLNNPPSKDVLNEHKDLTVKKDISELKNFKNIHKTDVEAECLFIVNKDLEDTLPADVMEKKIIDSVSKLSLAPQTLNGVTVSENGNYEDFPTNQDSSVAEINVTACQQSNEDVIQECNSTNSVSISDSVVLDKRIQELSLHVKDVRIRRDSDKLDDILNQCETSTDSESSDLEKKDCSSNESLVEGNSNNENGTWSQTFSENQTKEWIKKSLTTLTPRSQMSPLECSINSCLSHFTKPELLTGNNKFRCENCTDLRCKKKGNKKDVVYSNATKQLLIFSPPAILTLHLKRFTQVGMGLRKVNRFVQFPLMLDLAPFCSSACSILPHMATVDDEVLYSLYGIVEHSGRLTSGHYTAYIKLNDRTLNQTFLNSWPLAQCDLEQIVHKFSRISPSFCQAPGIKSHTEDSKWYYVSDSFVKEVAETQVLNCQAYLLFYERIK